MLTTDPGDSDEGYACKVLEVLIVHCHQSDAGERGRITGGWGGNTNGWSDVTVDGWGQRGAGWNSIHISVNSPKLVDNFDIYI